MSHSAAATFHELTGALDYPMLIVTTAGGGERAGCLIGFATQCSIDPPRFLVCLSEKNHTFRVASGSDALVVHFVSADSVELVKLFGTQTTDEVDKFARCAWHPGPRGLPVLDDCGRWFAGDIVARHDAGDHVVLILEPFAARRDDDEQGFAFHRAKHLQPGHEA